MLKRLLPRLRQAFPKARLRIRLDGGYSGAELFAFFEAERLEYVVGMAKNPALGRLAEPLMEKVRSDFEVGHASARHHGAFAYRAGAGPMTAGSSSRPR